MYSECNGLSARVPRAGSSGKRAKSEELKLPGLIPQRALPALTACSYQPCIPELPGIKTMDIVNCFGTPWYTFYIFCHSPSTVASEDQMVVAVWLQLCQCNKFPSPVCLQLLTTDLLLQIIPPPSPPADSVAHIITP